MFLETERLILRKFEESDLSDFCELVMDDELNRMMGNWPVDSEEKAGELLDWFLHGEKWAYAIVLRETGKLIGDLTIYEEPPEEVKNRPETVGKTGRALSFSISRQYRRQGLMEEAVRAVVGRLFAEGADYVNGGYFDFNLPSRAFHQKLGFAPLCESRVPTEDGGELTGTETVLWRKDWKE